MGNTFKETGFYFLYIYFSGEMRQLNRQKELVIATTAQKWNFADIVCSQNLFLVLKDNESYQ